MQALTTKPIAKEIPKMFKTDMVNAILRNKKRHTRRMDGLDKINKNPDAWRFDGENIYDEYLFYNVHAAIVGHEPPDCITRIKPRYRVGDRIWVKETFLDGEDYPCSPHHDDETVSRWMYRADCPDEQRELIKWRSAMFMPKCAARLWLEITKVRLERLRSISSDDALAEGVSQTEFWKPKEVDENPKPVHEWKAPFWDDYYFWTHYPQMVFEKLWKAINGADSWAKNPWVYVIEFKKL